MRIIRWEYTVLAQSSQPMDCAKLKEKLNTLGKLGWELVMVTEANGAAGQAKRCWVFKRPGGYLEMTTHGMVDRV
jgi:hypothetical protein